MSRLQSSVFIVIFTRSLSIFKVLPKEKRLLITQLHLDDTNLSEAATSTKLRHKKTIRCLKTASKTNLVVRLDGSLNQ